MNITDAEWEKATGQAADPELAAIEKRINGAWAKVDGQMERGEHVELMDGCPICDAFGRICCKQHNATAVSR